MNDDIKLLPCPCCGKQNLDHNDYLHPDGVMRVRCAWCHCEAPESAWNRRAAVEADRQRQSAVISDIWRVLHDAGAPDCVFDMPLADAVRAMIGQPAASAEPGDMPLLDDRATYPAPQVRRLVREDRARRATVAQEPVTGHDRLLRAAATSEAKDGIGAMDALYDLAVKHGASRTAAAGFAHIANGAFATLEGQVHDEIRRRLLAEKAAPVAAQAQQQIHPAIREGVEAAFEQRPGWLEKICAAVRHLPNVAAQVQPAMPPLTEAMRTVLRNEHCVYDSEDALYAALCDAAQAQPTIRESLKVAQDHDAGLADTQRAIIEAAERRGYERAIAECAQVAREAKGADHA